MLHPSFPVVFLSSGVKGWMTRQDDQRKNLNIETINSYHKISRLKCPVKKQCRWAVPKSQDSRSLCSLCRGLPSPPTRCPPTGRCRPDFAPPRSPRAPPSVWIESDGVSFTECSAVRTQLVYALVFSSLWETRIRECQCLCWRSQVWLHLWLG